MSCFSQATVSSGDARPAKKDRPVSSAEAQRFPGWGESAERYEFRPKDFYKERLEPLRWRERTDDSRDGNGWTITSDKTKEGKSYCSK